MRATSIALIAAVLLLAAATSSFAFSGFAFSLSEGTHQENGAINGTVTAVYPKDGLTFSWGIGDVPELVYDQSMKLVIEFTVLGAGNWKGAWVKSRNGEIPVSLHGLDPNPGTILTAELPSDCLVPDHLNSISMVVRDRGSNHRILWVKIGETNWSASLIRVRLITPLFDERCWSPVTFRGVTVTARQVFMLCHNGGIPSIGSADLDLLKQLVERQMADPPATTAAAPTVVSQAPAEPAAVASAPPAPTTPPAPQGPVVELRDLPQFTGSKHFECTLPAGVSRVMYSLTPKGSEPKWQEVELTSSHIRLASPPGDWVLRIRAIAPDGVIGPEVVREFAEGGESR